MSHKRIFQGKAHPIIATGRRPELFTAEVRGVYPDKTVLADHLAQAVSYFAERVNPALEFTLVCGKDNSRFRLIKHGEAWILPASGIV